MSEASANLAAIIDILVEETRLPKSGIVQTVALLGEGATVPFIARYRKEATGELDEVQIRLLQERLAYYQELEERRKTILKSIEEQGKLNDALRRKIVSTRQKTELEDLYLPYRPKRRTKALIAKERGLEPLAEQLSSGESSASAEQLAAAFINPQQEINNAEEALTGAGHIIAEQVADDAAARATVRELTWDKGAFASQALIGKENTVSKFEMYYDFSEPLHQIPSHRMLAMRRGEKELVLRLRIDAPDEEISGRLNAQFAPGEHRYAELLRQFVADACKRLLAPSIDTDLRLRAKQAADEEAIRVFAENLRNLLLAAPAGSSRVLGIDPGLRTGSKLAAVDATGRFLEHVTIYPHAGGAGKLEMARKELLRLIDAHDIEMVAIGNGTAGREMDQFTRRCLKEANKKIQVVMVSEAGASIYSASDIARDEFPDLDLTVRGAISIARRLQDPLAELVKVDPKSIGVGQYQHDVNQNALQKALDEVVESCVNYVGIDLNTASWALLSFVSGISEAQAKAIVSYRDENGSFDSRKQLLKAPRFGPKAFEQAAGFLRIRKAKQPLDNSAVHPERYKLVQQMAKDLGLTLEQLISDPARLDQLPLQNYVAADIGLPTLRDIVAELKKPGRDPRDSFSSTGFREDVNEMSDLKEGMTLNGIVTNVAAFGAFVDIGVHQDGLVHISQLADRFVKDPNQVVKVGQQVQVRVVSLDLQRKRIGLTMRSDKQDEGRDGSQKQERDGSQKQSAGEQAGGRKQAAKKQTKQPPQNGNSMAAAFEKSGFRVKKS
ncbi:MAG: RNA-binding transcriptional accessory protein [Desulfuromonadales bacterium]|nr:RNA-binding transcriptional accessory protein [Desulfuromonadales bacterium]